jgi:hypothetical protein
MRPPMPRLGWTLAVPVCILAAGVAGCGGAAQQAAAGTEAKPAIQPSVPAPAAQATPPAAAPPVAAPPTNAARTTLSGVYTMEQATRGRNVFLGTCRECHTEQEQTGEAFAKRWAGQTLGDLFQYLIAEMPKNDPGSLAPNDYTDVMAYMLRMNAMPAGPTALSSDVPALKAIKIVRKADGTTR